MKLFRSNHPWESYRLINLIFHTIDRSLTSAIISVKPLFSFINRPLDPVRQRGSDTAKRERFWVYGIMEKRLKIPLKTHYGDKIFERNMRQSMENIARACRSPDSRSPARLSPALSPCKSPDPSETEAVATPSAARRPVSNFSTILNVTKFLRVTKQRLKHKKDDQKEIEPLLSFERKKDKG